jgi:hypothetical protein
MRSDIPDISLTSKRWIGLTGRKDAETFRID